MKLLLALGLTLLGSVVQARPRISPGATMIARNDGNSNNPFTVACSSTAWTVVGSSITTVNTQAGPSRLRRRAMTVQRLSDSTYGVCLSSTSTAGNLCDDNRGGYELGSAWGSVSIYDEAIWYCRNRTGSNSTVPLKGVEHYDNRDENQ